MSTIAARRAFDEALRDFGEVTLRTSMAYLKTPTEEVSTLGQVDVNLATRRLLDATSDLCCAIVNADARVWSREEGE